MLPALMDALSALVYEGSPPTVCIYLDSCDDGSRATLRGIERNYPLSLFVCESHAASKPNAGSARRAALAMAIDLLAGRDGLLFTTDADSVPRSNWLQAGREALSQADIVAGRIIRAEGGHDAMQSRVERYYDGLYRYRRFLDPVSWESDDCHHFGGGANLAVRASAYRAIGGFKVLPVGEDATLLDDAARAGFRVRRDSAMSVVTSSRRDGRTEGGLAGCLRRFDAGSQPLVGDPRAGAWQWRHQALARSAFNAIDVDAVRSYLADRIGLTADHVLGVARDCPNAEAFAMCVVPISPVFADDLPLTDAERILDALIAVERGMAA